MQSREETAEGAISTLHQQAWIGFWSVALLTMLVALWAATDLGRSRALAEAEVTARNSATLAIAVLRGELEKQRALPLILARDPDVREALAGGDRTRFDAKLDQIAHETHAAVIYLLDMTGTAVAASNWTQPTSFVGNDYSFRDYFLTAITTGRAEQFALGTVSNRAGLYISRRIDGPDGPVGVIVVKVEFEGVEATWQALGGITFVSDPRGVVLISTIEDWRFRVERPLDSEEAAEIRRTLQFGAAPLRPLPVNISGSIAHVSGERRGQYLDVREPVPATPWQLTLLLAVDRTIRDYQAAFQAIAALALMPGIALGAILLRRRLRAGRARRMEARAKAELERRVLERTAELAGANARLMEEMTERAHAQERLSLAREELAKANRLATLGQVTAGVAHEINQPLAAIRTFAENARALLARGNATSADGAVARIVSLTERIGTITETLRGFARRGDGASQPVPLAASISGAMMILDGAFLASGITPRVDEGPEGIAVLARPVELEQVLVNLMRNAVEAIGAVPPEAAEPFITLSVAAAGDQVHIAIRDRGPGMTAAEVASLFTPFRSSKPRGLGLGLVISHGLVTGFGGTLTVESEPGMGTCFTISLRRAP